MKSEMNLLIKKLLFTMSISLLISHSHADSTLYESDTTYLSAYATLQTAFLTQNNSWFGKAQENIGHNHDSWLEGSIEPGLKGYFNLPSSSQLYYELSYRHGKTIGDDATGLTVGLNDPGRGEFEQAHIGWRSGELFSLADNLFEISIGQQDYRLAHGFLLWSGGSVGYKNGAWWIGGRSAFEDSGIVKINTGKIKTDIFRLKSRPQTGNAKDIRGGNFEYLANKHYTLGFSYLKVNQNDNASLDGADVFDFRLDINGLPSIPEFSFLGEYVKEKNGAALDAQGWYTDFSWQFKELSWQPKLSYRYASLEGDDPDTLTDEAFDHLHYGFPDWGTWYQGEIIGTYILGNSNLNSHLLRLKAKPSKDISLNLLYFRFLSDQPQSRGINSEHLADEINFIADWNINKSFSITGVLAIAIPGDGAKEMTNGNDNWSLGMLYGYYRF